MKYHNITTSDMLNGDDLGVVLWVAGCEHHCEGCHNKPTWNPDCGLPFDGSAEDELFLEISKDYHHRITFSGGDPMHPANASTINRLIDRIKDEYPDKMIWLYTGYIFEDMFNHEKITSSNQLDRDRAEIISKIDVLVDGRFEKDLADVNYRWAGSINQRVIDVKSTLFYNKVVIY